MAAVSEALWCWCVGDPLNTDQLIAVHLITEQLISSLIISSLIIPCSADYRDGYSAE